MSLSGKAPQPCYRVSGTMGDGTCEFLARYVTCSNCPDFARIGQTLFSREPDPGYLDEWTANVARPPAVPDNEGRGYLVFSVAGERLAAPVASLSRVFPPRTIHSVPGKAQSSLLGVVNLDGELTACLCLAHILGLSRSKNRAQAQACPLVAVHDELCDFAFPVEKVCGVRRIPDHELAPAPALVGLSEHPLVRGIAAMEEGSLAVLDDSELVNAAAGALR